MRKRVLVIGMLDSIHVGRWLEQFQDQEIDFILFPSKKFRQIHPRIRNLLVTNSGMRVNLFQGKRALALHGYLDFACRVLPKSFLNFDARPLALRRFLKKSEFDYIHCLEIQGAGYLLSDAVDNSVMITSKIIVTNWGSDIYYFKEFKNHEARIRKTLAIADYYSAECIRDYKLARELGFSGTDLPCIPNAGGFNLDNLQSNSLASSRRRIIIKTYGGTFGRGQYPIEAVGKVLSEFRNYSAYFYSVTDDLIPLIQPLVKMFPGRVQYSTQSNPISSENLHQIFRESRVYIGCSISDGISTSFLESLVSGTYPIQTNTSCANEWVAKGVVASVIPLDYSKLVEELERVLMNDHLVDSAQVENLRVAKENLGFDQIRQVGFTFYQ
jgi:glycosyltransferase involved in cell wall biosynthesis